MKLYYKFLLIVILTFLTSTCNRDAINEPIDNNIAPLTPTDLQIYGAFDGQIGIRWRRNSELNIKEYKIYRSVNKPDNFKFIQSTTDNFYNDYYLDYDSTYYYKISAVNLGNLESPLTNCVSAKPINFYSPLSPYNLRINGRNWSDKKFFYLYWDPPPDTDIKGYEIYRSTFPGFDADTSHFYDFTIKNSFTDYKDIGLLTKYYYRLKSVDKGNLKSPATSEVNDVVLNSPLLISPPDNSTIKEIIEFKFKTVSLPAKYKLVIQSNEIYGTIKEFELTSDQIDQEITVNVQGLSLESSKTYIWRVYTYTNSESDPNSFSNYFTFTFNPF